MNDTTGMTFASRLKLERQKRSWTQEQLAERAHLSPRTVQRLEGGTEASAETLRLVAEAFGLPAEQLRGTGVRTHFRAPWCRTVKIVTAAVIALAAAVSLWDLPLQPAWLPPAALRILFWALILGSLLLSVNGFSVRDGRLWIHRLGWATTFDLAELSAFEANPHAMMGSVRLFGNGGMFCISGLYRNAVIGRYRAYVTHPDHAVVLEFGARKIVVSPDDPQAFVDALNEATPGICRSADRAES